MVGGGLREDIGKIIGKTGRTIGAIRTIVQATRADKERHYNVEILE